MAKLPDLLTELFDNINYANSSSGMAQLIPGIQSRKKAVDVVDSAKLDKAYLAFGASLAREVATDLLRQGIKPADQSRNEKFLEAVKSRISRISPKKLSLVIQSFSEQISKIG